MKEAAGEANKTVIVIVLIGVVAALGLVIVPKLAKRIKGRSCCNAHNGIYMTCNPGTEAAGKWCCGWDASYDNSADRAAFRSCRDS